MNKFSDRLKTALESRDISASELSRMTKIARSSISDWLSGKYEAKQDKVFIIAQALRVDEGWLMGLDVPMEKKKNIVTIYNELDELRKERVYTYAEELLEEQTNVINVDFTNNDSISIVRGRRSAAGLTIVGDDSGAYEEVLSASMIPKGADELVEITGSSMEPLIEKGTEVFLRYQPTIENGEIAIVRIENEGVTCKRVYFDDGTITLKSENPEYEDMHFDPSQVTVLGKVLL